jgi:glutamate 5-kinase
MKVNVEVNFDQHAQRTQYLNAANTMNELLNMGIIPIVNENDTLAVTVGGSQFLE